MACARFSFSSVKRVPSVSIPIRRISTTTIQNTRSTFHVNVKLNQLRSNLWHPVAIPTPYRVIFSRKFATSAKEFEDEITRLIQQKDFDAAEKTFKNMREQKVNPSQSILSSMIGEFSAAGRTDKSLEFYDVLRKLGYSPDENVLNIVVSSLSQKFKTSAKPKESQPQQQQQQQQQTQQTTGTSAPPEQVQYESEPIIEEAVYDEEDYEDLEDLEEELEEGLEAPSTESLTEHPIVIVHETGNNVFATAVFQGKTLTSLSAGALGFKGSKRSTSVAAEALGRGVSQRLLERGYATANIVLRTSPSSNSEGALKGLFAQVQLPQSQKIGQLEIRNVAYHLCIAHNGCRPKKPRRV